MLTDKWFKQQILDAKMAWFDIVMTLIHTSQPVKEDVRLASIVFYRQFFTVVSTEFCPEVAHQH